MLVAGTLPEGGRRGERAGNSLERREECPKLRFRRRGCSYRYECKEECTEKKDCKTTYQYKCKEYKKQVKIRLYVCTFRHFLFVNFRNAGMFGKTSVGAKMGSGGARGAPGVSLIGLTKTISK